MIVRAVEKIRSVVAFRLLATAHAIVELLIGGMLELFRVGGINSLLLCERSV